MKDFVEADEKIGLLRENEKPRIESLKVFEDLLVEMLQPG